MNNIKIKLSFLATIVALEDTWCATLSRTPFKAILEKLERDKINSRIQIINTFLHFDTFTKSRKIRICKGIQEVNLKRGNIVYYELDKANKMYFVIEGELEMSK